MENTIIPNNSRIRVIWEEIPENYSKQGEKQVKELFSKKYGVSKDKIKVVFSPIKVDVDGNKVSISDSGLENVMDQNYQRDLMQKWLKLNKKNVNFDRLMKLDDNVNASLNYDYESSFNKRWRLKWIALDNFLSFGDGNVIDLTNFKGFNFVCSNPVNQGGKTTFTVDAIMFLLFGKTSKTDKNAGIFNRHRDNDIVKVRGMIEYEGKELIIERKLTRKLKTDGTHTVTTKMSYYEILPDGEEKKMNAEETKSTTEEIRKIVGLESDFEIVVCATGDNLENSVKGTPSQRGALITRFIGLEPIMEKEKIVRTMYNEFSKKLKGNLYNVIELADEVSTHRGNIEMCDALLEKHLELQTKLKVESSELTTKRDKVLGGKVNVNNNLSKVNPETLANEIETITKKGVSLKEDFENFNKEVKKLEAIKFNEDKFHKISTEKFDLELKQKKISSDNVILKAEIENLKNAEFCVTCNSPLKDVDNTKKISEKEELIKENDKNFNLIGNQITEKITYIDKNKDNQEKVKKRNRLELDRDRVEIEIGRLRNNIKEKINIKKEFDLNLESININKAIDVDISKIDTDIVVNRTNSEKVINQLQLVRNDRENNLNELNKKDKLIKEINSEEEVVRIFKVYIEMIGNKGISKLILRSVLPIINSELFRLMDEICDFTLEMNINSKNEVDYFIVKDEIKSPIKSGSGLERTISALAVRVILGRLTTLPTPNFIVFDEILGKIANENIETMKILFDKITEMYDSIFFITHRDLVKDWADNIITIDKDSNNISSFS